MSSPGDILAKMVEMNDNGGVVDSDDAAKALAAGHAGDAISYSDIITVPDPLFINSGDVVAFGAFDLNLWLESLDEANVNIRPVLTLKGSYNVTFQDPTKPAATVFKRYNCYDGDEFYLKGFRSTIKNPLIGLFEPGNNVARNMRNKAKGAGLKSTWDTAEFTVKSINNDRMNGQVFLRDIYDRYTAWNKQRGFSEDVDRGDIWGSW